ncbi:uncharacterized protein C8Q71DRAFT_336691 [Rhodofomes roseus]|uniref:Secreted protein n=1 Tax=Rhodofomes roseus TaxID=34475 RepID=A0ABQ8KSK7_9APHY|nr:uncharacterized protein C8Q71DRAFT_336691 [Rhodofomes roseus]KAH9841544.1 hypothetical protein C8Q71DRAFT_336691 [Rhodofomes roseus]
MGWPCYPPPFALFATVASSVIAARQRVSNGDGPSLDATHTLARRSFWASSRPASARRRRPWPMTALTPRLWQACWIRPSASCSAACTLHIHAIVEPRQEKRLSCRKLA